MENKIGKTLNLELVGVDGNAYAIMGAFSRQARREKWTQEEIDSVLQEAIDGDYDHLLSTIMTYCEPQDNPEVDSNPENENY
ncbi:hypothetical protein QWT87_11400 [Chryseobacterium sp. APV1]|uniref:Uncharacterized protein n=1 Tax=Chryseobacterium urinae TaxID=3058400 RepID=A0ABT8U505_9FLAO|nr:hypothetical protein [Chryseobacterium sp. APV1]MDO3425497.1 hypothetical protein [Chryseobacterium sp. APV1]